MGLVNMNSLSIILGSMRYPNSSLQVRHDSKVYSPPGGGCCCDCPREKKCGCHDPCALDLPEVYKDPLEGIPSDDASLTVLVGLQWPRRDFPWFIQAYYAAFVLRRLRRNVIQPIDEITDKIRNKSSSPSLKTTTEATITPVPIITENPLTGAVDISTLTQEDKTSIQKFAEEFQLDVIAGLRDNPTIGKIQGDALNDGRGLLQKKTKIEAALRAFNITFSANDPSLKHQNAFRRTSALSTLMAKGGFIFLGATLSFKERVERAIQLSLRSVCSLLLLRPIENCFEDFQQFGRPVLEPCSPDSPYRMIDGTCNNAANKLWGASFTPYRRDLCPKYDDGISTFRRSVVNNQPLPSSRTVSTSINTVRSEASHGFSILHMTFGQFIDHDLVRTPIAKNEFGYFGGAIKCCNTSIIHLECDPIDIPADDEFYSWYGQTCMEFVRSASVLPFCSLAPREQSNEHTAYLDGSVIYGVQPSETDSLRTFTCGQLKGQVAEDGRMLLPKEMNEEDGCNTPDMISKGKYCFKAGDGRVNEQILLTFFQTLFAREHNRISAIFCRCHPNWNDEKIFQETRRIVGALLQQVTYNEFLHTIIGATLMTSSKLWPLKEDEQTDDYDPYINAAIGNNFATAAFRFGHSVVADSLLYVTKHGLTTPKELSTLYFNPFDLYRKDAVCDVARGGLNLPEDKMDPYFSLEITGKLFRGSLPFGLDLLALNIQRGRDHGLPAYVKWREFCGLPKVYDFNDLSNEMSLERIQALKNAYQHVDDIDLYAGGVSENPIPGSILGHTFTCLIHNQFFRMKYGDRYWFEYKNGPGAFKPDQIEQLHEATLARIMCNNLPELKYIQRWPLRNPGPDNPKVCCKSIRLYSLKPWVPGCPIVEDP